MRFLFWIASFLVIVAIAEPKTFNCDYNKKSICKIENESIPAGTTEIEFAVASIQNETLGIWFEKTNLEYVPGIIFQTFKKLALLKVSGTEIPILKRDYLKQIAPITALELTRDNIETVEEDAFQDLTNLRQISLFSNRLKMLPEKLFQNNLNLEVIDFNENQIEAVGENFLAGLEKLTEISFHSNQLKTVPKKLFKDNKMISKIALNENHLISIDEDLFVGLRNLTEVYLSTNQLQFISPKLFRDNKFITSIYLNNNKLKRIDENLFVGLKNLRTLSLASNEIESFPIQLFADNEMLDYIYLNNNKIKMLTPVLFQSNSNRLRSFVDLTDNVCINQKFDVFDMIGQQLKEAIENCKNASCNLDQDTKYFKTIVLTNIVENIKNCTEKCYEDEDCLGEVVRERNNDVIFTIFHELSSNEKHIEKVEKLLEDKLVGLQTLDETKNKTVNSVLKEQKDRTDELDARFSVIAILQVIVIVLLIAVIAAIVWMFKRLRKEKMTVVPEDTQKNNAPDSTNI
jgi:hypothetical protein